uniref:Uncharacterized protein n=1 Tax=Pelusios castaneus TaxID=367368 RepID=A0A8C8VMM8_9SAUR
MFLVRDIEPLFLLHCAPLILNYCLSFYYFILFLFFFFFLLLFIYFSLFFPPFHFLCFSSLSPVLLPGPSPDVCLLAVLLFKNILSMPLRASVR